MSKEDRDMKMKHLKDIEKMFFQKYSGPYCEYISFLNHMWDIIKKYIMVTLGLKDESKVCGSEIMLAAMYINDLEVQYGPFMDS